MAKLSREQLLNLEVQFERSESQSTGKPCVIALDYGQKFCGLAMAPDGQTVLPAAVVETSKLETALESLKNQYEAKTLVIGLPLSSDGTENQICEMVRDLRATLAQTFNDLTVELVNERHSSQAVLAPEKSRIDDLAAMHILEFYLSQSKK